MNDPFQERYLAHQENKKNALIEIMKLRHSSRMFANQDLPESVIQEVTETKKYCPSSCDRQAISMSVITGRDEKSLLSGLLVGGTGWIHRAPVVVLLFADPLAYKAGDEINYMPYLDAGVVIQQLYLTATAMELHCAYSNPNIREFNVPHFKRIFGDGIFCGAFAFGYPPVE